jgi:hypothetical protein
MNDQQNNVPQNDPDRAAWHEELRFAKKQQWYVATSAVTLLAAIFAIARSTSLSVDERGTVTFLIFLVATFGIDVLRKLQLHMSAKRQELNPRDQEWHRDSDVLFVLAGIIAVAAAAVSYLLWFHALS